MNVGEAKGPGDELMMRRFVLSVALLLGVRPDVLAAQDQRNIGIVPFDVASVEGGGVDAGRALATLVRVEMMKNKQLLPQLLKLPDGVQLPLASKQAAEVGRDAQTEFVLVGTVLEATIARSNNRGITNRLGETVRGMGAVGGSVTRVTAKISVHAQLVASGSGKVEAFEVAAKNTDVGVGVDFWTTLGAVGTGDDGWQKTPMGKALREAAQKLTEEVARRTAKRDGA